MNYNSTFVYEMDIKDLMFAVLRRWKLIISIAILLALLLGGYKGFATYKSGTNAASIEAADKKYNEAVTEYEKKTETLEKEINNITEDIAEQEEYLEKSIWLKVSPYDICEARADVYVTTDYTIMPGMNYQNVDYTETILQVYQSLLTSNEVKEEISLKVDTEPRYLDELLSVEKDGRILTINVKHATKAEAQAILSDMLMWLNELKPQVVSAIGEHTVSVVNNSVGFGVDLEHAETLTTQEQKLADLEASLLIKQKELDELVEPQRNEFTMSTAVKSAVKFAVLGGVLGAFMVVFVVCVVFLMSDKVYSAKELKKRFGIKELGALPAKTCKCPIDQLLNKLEGRVFEEDENVRNGLIAQNVRNMMGEVKKLLVLGSADVAYIEVVANALQREISEIQVISGGNMLKDVDTLKKLSDCEGIVLVEACGVSDYGDIAVEIEKATDLGKSIVGCVVIG